MIFQTNSQSSVFGRTWWGRQWVYALEALGEYWPNRLPRGRGYAQAGKVYDLVTGPGLVTAKVSGSGPRPYRVQISLKTYTKEQWDLLVESLASQAKYTVRLLQGEMPENLPQVCGPLGLPLFPQANNDLTTTCSCPDIANPCKHVAAVLYILGQALDQDPFQLLSLRGMSRREIMEEIEKKRIDISSSSALTGEDDFELTESTDDNMLAIDYTSLSPDQFWQSDLVVEELSFEIKQPSVRVPSLRKLGAPPSWSDPVNFINVFDPIYEDASELALRISSGQSYAMISTKDEVVEVQEEQAVKQTSKPQVIPKLASMCQAILVTVMDQGYIRPQDKEIFSPQEQLMFPLAIQALVMEGILCKEGNGRNLRYVHNQ